MKRKGEGYDPPYQKCQENHPPAKFLTPPTPNWGNTLIP